MGAVYLATDQRFGSSVALKETLVAGEPLRRAFEREARLLNTLQHASLPHVIDHFFEGDGQFLVMQYIPGEDLGHMLRRRQEPFPVDDVLRWADQLLDLLDYLHTHEPPIVHRDIKPENLKLTQRGNVILLDFGLAKGLADQAVSTTQGSASIVGYTPHYASLEQIRGTGTDARSDLYSLAATLYHLLTRRLPPDAVSRAESFVNGTPDPLRPAHELSPAVPPALGAILHAAMGLRRDDRFASAAAMRSALRGVAGAPVTAATPDAETRVVAPATVVVAQARPTTPDVSSQPPPPPPPPSPTSVETVPQTFPSTAPTGGASGTGIALGLGVAALLVVAVAAAAIVYLVAIRDRGTAPPPPSPVVVAPQPQPQPPPQPVAPQPPVGLPVAPLAEAPDVTATASTSRVPAGGNTYTPGMALDGSPATAWIEGGEGHGVGESITLKLSAPARVSRVRLQPGYFKSPDRWSNNNRLARVRVSLSDGREMVASFRDEMREQAIAIGGAPVSSITITIEEVYVGGDELDTAISEIAVDVQ